MGDNKDADTVGAGYEGQQDVSWLIVGSISPRARPRPRVMDGWWASCMQRNLREKRVGREDFRVAAQWRIYATM